MALYIGTTEPVATIDWDEGNPAFTVQEVLDPHDSVRRQFTTPRVYYLGAHTGCSCGFAYGDMDVDSPDNTEAEETAGRRSVALLRAFLLDAVRVMGEVELFACWDGDQGEPPDHHLDIAPDFFGGEAFSLPEKARFRLRLPGTGDVYC